MIYDNCFVGKKASAKIFTLLKIMMKEKCESAKNASVKFA